MKESSLEDVCVWEGGVGWGGVGWGGLTWFFFPTFRHFWFVIDRNSVTVPREKDIRYPSK